MRFYSLGFIYLMLVVGFNFVFFAIQLKYVDIFSLFCCLRRYFTKLLLLRVPIFSYEVTCLFFFFNFYWNAFSFIFILLRSFFVPWKNLVKSESLTTGNFPTRKKVLILLVFYQSRFRRAEESIDFNDV